MSDIYVRYILYCTWHVCTRNPHIMRGPGTTRTSVVIRPLRGDPLMLQPDGAEIGMETEKLRRVSGLEWKTGNEGDEGMNE